MLGKWRRTSDTFEKDIAEYGIEAYAAARGLLIEPFDESLIEIARSGAAE